MKRNIFLTSDHHFDHANVIKYCDRPFDSIEAMNEELIKRHNRAVKPSDVVYFLGDITWNTSSQDYISRMNGIKYLVMGNHDRMGINQGYNKGYMGIFREVTIKIGKVTLVLSHYPYKRSLYRKWYNLLKGVPWRFRHEDKMPIDSGKYLAHGHTHGKYFQNPYHSRCFHIGVDAHNYYPVNVHKIMNIVKRKKL